MDTAMRKLEDQFDIDISEYTICAKRAEDGEFYHFWYLGTSDKDLDLSTVAKALDDSLKSANKNYQVARDKALNGVKITLIDPAIFQDWSTRNKKKGGQVKMERVMNEEKFSEWENFVKIH
jgi:hypothetical protein